MITTEMEMEHQQQLQQQHEEELHQLQAVDSVMEEASTTAVDLNQIQSNVEDDVDHNVEYVNNMEVMKDDVVEVVQEIQVVENVEPNNVVDYNNKDVEYVKDVEYIKEVNSTAAAVEMEEKTIEEETKMAEPWHIPRASLGSISSSSKSSQKSNSTPSSVHGHRKQLKGYTNRAYTHNKDGGTKDDEIISTTTSNNISNSNNEKETNKRGSRSSQGSNDSYHSSKSASSGSLLLTVANLENFVKINRKTEDEIDNRNMNLEAFLNNSQYNSNITLQGSMRNNEGKTTSGNNTNSNAIDTIIDTNLLKFKSSNKNTKDIDTISMASSTHFTVVNGMGGPQKLQSNGLCSRGHQITVLIVTMSVIFMIGISAAVFFLELRARDMPH